MFIEIDNDGMVNTDNISAIVKRDYPNSEHGIEFLFACTEGRGELTIFSSKKERDDRYDEIKKTITPNQIKD